MKTYLAIVIYRCRIDDERTDSFDFQVRWMQGDSEEGVRSQLEAEEVDPYLNSDGETVRSELVTVMEVEEWQQPDVGGEIIGFIAHRSELQDLLFTD